MAKITVDLGDGKKASVEVGSLAQEDTLQRLLKIMDVTGKASTINTQKSQKAVDGLGDAASGAADALENTATSFDDISDEVDAAADRMKDASSKFKKDLASDMFRNTKSLFSGMSSPMDFLKSSAGDLGKGFGGLLESAAAGEGAVAGLAEGMLMLGGPITLLGAAIASVIAFLVGRAMKNLEMYDKILKSGATFAGGLEQFRDTVTQSSLNLEDFTAVASKNADKFAFFGGTVAQGAVKFAAVSKEVGKFGVSFRNLGISAEEMGDIQASYMEQMAMSGDLAANRAKSDSVIAAGAMGYAKNLKIMSSLTGQSIEAEKAEQLEKSKDYRIQIAARTLAADAGIDFQTAMQTVQNEVKKHGEISEVVISKFTNHGAVLGQAANQQAAVFNASAKSADAGYSAILASAKNGNKNLMSLNEAATKAEAGHVEARSHQMDVGTLAFQIGVNQSNGAVSELGEVVASNADSMNKSVQITEGFAKAQADVTALEEDRKSVIARQHALENLGYNVQKKALDMTDSLAISGMASLQDAMVKFAITIYKYIPGMGKMPDDLQAMSDQMDANAAATRQATDAKIVEAKVGKDAAAAATAAISQDSITAAVTQQKPPEEETLIHKALSVSAGLAGAMLGLTPEGIAAGAVDGIMKADTFWGAVGGAIQGAVEAPLKGYQLGSKVGGGAVDFIQGTNQILPEVAKQLEQIRNTEAGQKLNDAELRTLLIDTYRKQGLVLDESLTKITQGAAPPQAAPAGGPAPPQAAPAGGPAPPQAAPAGGPAATAGGPPFADGGIAKGSKKGFPATLHGTEAVVPLPDNKSIPVSLPDSITRIVAQGETLSGIAMKSQTTIDAIMKANPQLTDPNKIRAGAAINIPTPPPPPVVAIEKPQEPEGGMFSGLRAGFDSILKSVQDSLPSAENIEKSIMDLTTSSETKSIDNVRATMIEVRDLIKSQNELLNDLLDHTKTGVKVQKDIRSNSY